MTYGCKQPKIDIRDYKIKAGVNINLPASYTINNLPRVKNQNNINSCVAHASSSILEYYTNNKINLSTNFIYGMERSVCGEQEPGMYLVDACKIIQEYGDMLETDCPGNYEVPKCSDYVETIAKDNSKMETAKIFRLSRYYDCGSTNDIKYAIMTYGPVLGCIYWYDDFKIMNVEGKIAFNTSSSGGYHAIMIYGWTEEGFLIQNSWGTSFGRNGRFLLPYNYQVAEAKAMIDYENAKEVQALIHPSNNYKPIKKGINTILNTFTKKKVKIS